ncbi:hypothetical protein [Nevskia ramosa]|uniref:hypothetical protein n=1 Tax=Nevskia ramosa TaxID=64002 RepID=UPI003D103B6C
MRFSIRVDLANEFSELESCCRTSRPTRSLLNCQQISAEKAAEQAYSAAIIGIGRSGCAAPQKRSATKSSLEQKLQ